MKYFFVQGRTDKSVGFSHLQQRSSKDIASCCVQLLPALCSHLENCHNHFQVRTQMIRRYERRHGFFLPVVYKNLLLCLYTFLLFSPDTAVWEQRRCGRTLHRCSGAPADVIRLPAAPADPEHHLQLVRRTSTTDWLKSFNSMKCQSSIPLEVSACLWLLFSFAPDTVCVYVCVYLSGLDSASQDRGAYWRRLWVFWLDD